MIDYSRLRQKINPERDGQDVLQLRTGIITAVGTNGRVTVNLNGVTISDVPYLLSAGIVVNSVVQILAYRGSLLVIGTASGANQSVGGQLFAELTADLAATTAAAGITVHSVTLPTAGTFAFDFRALFSVASNTVVLGFALGGTSTPASFRWNSQTCPYQSATGLEGSQGSGSSYPANVSQIVNASLAVNTGFGSVSVKGRVTVSAGGTLTFRIGRVSGSGSITVRQSSNVSVKMINPP